MMSSNTIPLRRCADELTETRDRLLDVLVDGLHRRPEH
jgi:hypothetical protein